MEIMPDYDSFVATMHRIRKTRHVTLMKLGARIGRRYQSISQWLRGEATMRGPIIWDLAHGLGYDIALIRRGATCPCQQVTDPASTERRPSSGERRA